MNEIDRLIKLLMKERGGTKQQYLQLLSDIANHETGGTFDPTTQQNHGKRGIGKGLYQLEGTKNGRGITAARRTVNLYRRNNMRIKPWLKNATSIDSLDATKLTGEQQSILFLADMREHPRAKYNKLWDGTESTPEFWAKYHWSGDKKDYNTRLASFKSTYKPQETPNKISQEKKLPTLPTTGEVFSNEFREMSNIVRDPKEFWKDLKSKINTGRTKQGHKFKDQVKTYNDYYAKQDSITKKLAYGGPAQNNQNLYDGDFSSFNGGGSHSQNPLGGIPMGVGENGKQNAVEAGEASYNFKKQGKFIFSNRVSLDGIIKK